MVPPTLRFHGEGKGRGLDGQTQNRIRVLILGGYGTFGGRLVRLLADEPRLTLLVAGRSRGKAEAFADSVPGTADIRATAFDRDADVAHQLRRLAPHVVVDCSGPFQAYGDDPYRVVRAAIAQGAHYLDLADAPGFVRDITALDAEAKLAGVFALSGASSTPTLTAAAVRRLADELAHVDRISAGITPSPRALMGRSVIAAVTACAGQPVERLKDGRPGKGIGLLESRRVSVAPPGVIPLHGVRFSLADTPDLSLLPERYPGLTDVWFGAGIRPGLLQRMLNLCAWLVRARLLPRLTRFTPFLTAAHWAFRWGEHRSGMFVAVEGRDVAGRPRSRSWHVVARGDDGPSIPAMAAAVLIRKLLAGTPPQPGARPALEDVTLADYEAAFAGRDITAGVREDDVEEDASLPLYRRVLGSAWDALPEPVRALHDLETGAAFAGAARVERGLLGGWIADAIGFPRPGEALPLRVELTACDRVETWTRDFAGARFTSTQVAGTGADKGLLVERFGPLEFLLGLKVEGADGTVDRDGNALSPAGTRLRLVVRGWRAWGIGLPRFLAPFSDAFEQADEQGRFRFHVEISHPLVGLIVRYRGWLEPAGARAAAQVAVELETARGSAAGAGEVAAGEVATPA